MSSSELTLLSEPNSIPASWAEYLFSVGRGGNGVLENNLFFSKTPKIFKKEMKFIIIQICNRRSAYFIDFFITVLFYFFSKRVFKRFWEILNKPTRIKNSKITFLTFLLFI